MVSGFSQPIPRHLEAVLVQRLEEEPVVVLNGPRTVGKSTLLAACARAHGAQVLDLDDLETRRAVAADPALFVASDRLVCIDEFQHVLPVLDAIKAELNRDLRPGRFVLTGSTRYTTLPRASQSLAGRAHILNVWPFSQGELQGTREQLLDQLFTDPTRLVTSRPSVTTRADYERLILAGGFPLALKRTTDATRGRWYADFTTLVVHRDAREIRNVRQPAVLGQVLRRLAARTAQLLKVSTIADTIPLDRTTVEDYIDLLERVFLVHRLQAFGTTLSSRMNRSPKVHLVDSGLAAHLLGLTAERLQARQPSVLTEFGHVVETFAVNEILKQASWAQAAFTFSHLRTPDDVEVDLIAESADGRLAGIEIKGTSSVDDRDLRGLRVLRDRTGAAFAAGVVLHLGTHAYRAEDSIYVLPLDRLWT